MSEGARGPARLWQDPRAAAWAAALVAVVVYLNALGNGFAYDDVHIVVENESIQRLETLPNAIFRPYWPEESGRELGLWRPVTTAVLGLEYSLFGQRASLYHAVNVALHAGVTALAVLLAAQLTTVPVALLGGLLFAVHPVHVEAVANVVGVAELLAAFFFLLACLVHLRSGAAGTWRSAAALAGLYLLAFGAKEGAATLPAALLVLDAARERLTVRDLRDYLARRWRVYAAMAVVAAAMLVGRERVLGSIASPLGPLGAGLLEEGVPRIWTLGAIWSHYVRLLALPLDLSSDYVPDVLPIHLGWGALNTVGVVLALSVLGAALWACRVGGALKRGADDPAVLAWAVAWFLVTIAPVANVFFLSGVLLAERTLYLPSVAATVAMGWLLVRGRRRRPALVAALTVALVAVFVGRTWTRTPVWKSNDTVFLTMIEEYPQSGRSQWVLGDLFLNQGRVSEGLQAYRAAIGILGNHYYLSVSLARRLMDLEMLDAARLLLRYAAESRPEYSTAYNLLAVAASRAGDAVETEWAARNALRLVPEDAVNQHLLAWALEAQGRFAEAAEARWRVIELGEGEHWQQWLSLARLEAASGDTTSALAALDSALVRAHADSVARGQMLDFRQRLGGGR